MTLQAEMTVRLSAKPLADRVVADLAAPLASLTGVRLVAEGGAVSARWDASQVLGAASNLSADLTTLLGRSLDPARTVVSLTTTLDLLEEIGIGDLRERLTALFGRLGRELEDSAGEGFVAGLDRLFGLMNTTPESKHLLDLLDRALRAAGVASRPELGSALPATVATIRAIGALMVLDTVLAEGERLSGIIAAQVDPAVIDAELGALRGRFAAAAQAVTNLVDAGFADARAVDLAREQILAAAAHLAALESHLARALGFGEATLVYWELGRLEGEVATAVAGLRSVDPDLIAAGVRQIVAAMRPMLALELPGSPAENLDALLTTLESKMSTVAQAIDALDVNAAVAPISRGLEALAQPIEQLGSDLAALTGDVRGTLESVRQAVARLPFDDVAHAVDAALAPVTSALDALEDVVASVSSQLGAAAGTITTALGAVEHAVDDFRGAISQVLGDAAAFVEGKHLDQVVGEVGGRVREFATALGSARMGPYFDTTVSTIDTAAAVVEALPMSLMPESMKPDLDAALAPVRGIDVAQVEVDIEGLVGIEDGKFPLRAVLTEALQEIQHAYDALVAEVLKADPRQLKGLVQPRLDEVAGAVRDAVPSVTLDSVEAAITQAKHALDGVDLRAALQPADDAFTQALALVDRYDPTQLLAPLQTRLASTREQLLAALGLENWAKGLEGFRREAQALMDRLDPAQLAQVLEPAVEEARRLLDSMSRFDLGDVIGDLVASAIAGGGQRISGRAFRSVMTWLEGTPGSNSLDARRLRIVASVQQTRSSVRSIDLRGLRLDLNAQVSAMLSAVARHPPGDTRLQLESAIGRLAVEPRLVGLAANQDRYLAALDQAVVQTEQLGRQGLSEVDVTVGSLRAAFAPAAAVREFIRRILDVIGVRPEAGGLVPTLRAILATASPQRLVRILEPIFSAIRRRLGALIDAVIAPLAAAIDTLVSLVRGIDVGAVQEGVGEVVAELRGQIARFAPSVMLGPSLDAFDTVRSKLRAFDPLAPVRAVLDAVRETASRVAGKLNPDVLLGDAIRIYDSIVAALRAIDIETLLAPLLDTLDTLAAEVDTGLDRVTQALVRLQSALPSPGGGASVSVEATLSIA